MTNINVAATKPSTTKDKQYNLRYDAAISSLIIILNAEAIMYMTTHKIPLPEVFLTCFGSVFCFFSLFSCTLWILAITTVSLCKEAHNMGRFSHSFGLLVFLYLIYCISPFLHLLFCLHFVLPCLLWLVAGWFGPCLFQGMKATRDWWKFVNQPQ
ncbi:hypothetical protein N665_4256s0002 [Sinapis alba]|nr:hypothetical protein N665_4256s0002 [Sinapis alba]